MRKVIISIILFFNFSVLTAEDISKKYFTGAVLSTKGSYESIPPFKNNLTVKTKPSFSFSWIPKSLSQGQQGSCVGWAVGYAAKSISHKIEKNKGILFSPSYVYNSENKRINNNDTTCKKGIYIKDAIDSMTVDGILPKSEFPYTDKSCSTIPSSQNVLLGKAYKSYKGHRVIDAKILPRRFVSDKEIEDIKNILSNKIPVIIAMEARSKLSQWENKKENDVFDDTNSPFWNNEPSYHAMTVVGFSDYKNAFRLLNSWGTSWGHNGHLWISYEAFKKLVYEAHVIEEN